MKSAEAVCVALEKFAMAAIGVPLTDFLWSSLAEM